MTLPTITYGVGWQDDMGDASNYSEVEDGNTATLTVDNGTVFNIAVSGSAGNKIVYYELDITNIASATYGKFIVRYKTSSTSIKAKFVLIFTSGNQVVMAETSSETWTTATADVTGAKTIDKIRLYATQATGNVYFDFASIYTGMQTFHNFDDLDVNPRIKKSVNPIPLSDTDNTQHLGRANTLITIEGPMRSGKTWGGNNLTFGEFLMQLLAERNFQWFTSDQGDFKVTPVPEGFHFRQSKERGYQLHYRIQLEEYDEGDASVFGSPAWYKA